MHEIYLVSSKGLPSKRRVKESACQCKRHRRHVFDPWVGFPRGRNANSSQYSCLENLMDRGAWLATVHGIVESDMTEQLSMARLPISIVLLN